MSIDIEAMLIYGVPYKDLPEDILEEVDEMLDNAELDYASPWYDSEREYWIVGVGIPCWGESPWELKDAIEEAYGKLPSFFGSREQLGLYVTPHVS